MVKIPCVGWGRQQSGERGKRIGDGHGGALGLSLRGAPPPGGGRRSMNGPPPSVCCAETSRTTKRSGTAAAIGRSSTSWTWAECAGFNRVVAEQDDARPDLGGGMVQAHRKPLADWFRHVRQQAQTCIDAIRRRVQLGVDDDIAAPDRIPGDARAREIERAAVARMSGLRRRFWACSERTRADRPDGLTTTWSPTCTEPESTVPVTTTPTPASVKTRSTARRKRPSRIGRRSVAAPPRRARNSSMPWPVKAETGRMSAPASTVPASCPI